MLRIALIGAGRWGKNYIHAVANSGLGQITSVRTREKRVAQGTCPQEDSERRMHGSLDEVLDGVDKIKFDAAIVATHPPNTAAISIELLKRGLPVMAEKPVSLELNALNELQTEIERSRLPFLINHQHLFSHGFQSIVSKIGHNRIFSFESEAGGDGPHRSYCPIWDYGPHDLAMFFYLNHSKIEDARFESFQEVKGVKQKIDAKLTNGGSASFSVWTTGGAKIHSIKITAGVDRIIYRDQLGKQFITINENLIHLPYEPPLDLSVRAFMRAVAANNSQKEFQEYFGLNISYQYTTFLTNLLCSQFNIDNQNSKAEKKL